MRRFFWERCLVLGGPGRRRPAQLPVMLHLEYFRLPAQANSELDRKFTVLCRLLYLSKMLGLACTRL